MTSHSGEQGEITMRTGIMRKSPDSISWQDYRASTNGMIVVYASDPVSEMAIREIPDELTSAVTPEPNYESGTYGFFGCDKTKIRGAFAKSKVRYLFFLTKYAGSKEEFKDKMLITGFYRIAKTADVQKLHLRYLDECSCIDAASCIALRADEVHFVGLSDAFVVTEAQLKTWGYNAKVSRQLRIILSPENTSQMLGFLKEKPNQINAYIAETKRLSPEDEEEKPEEENPELSEQVPENKEIRETTVFPHEAQAKAEEAHSTPESTAQQGSPQTDILP
jgi:hypothetical protein